MVVSHGWCRKVSLEGCGKRRELLIALHQKRPDRDPLVAPLVTSVEIIEEQLRAANRLLES